MDDHIVETSEEVLNDGVKRQRKGPLIRNTVCIAIGTILLASYLVRCLLIGYALYFKIMITSIWLFFQIVYRWVLKKSKDNTQNYFIGVTNLFFTFLFAVFLFCSNIIPIGILSHSSGKYKVQKKYAISRMGFDLSMLPDDLPDNITNYELDAVPSYLQGTGHFTINFRADDEVIAEYEKECMENAVYTFGFSEMNDHYYKVEKVSPKAKQKTEDDDSLLIYYKDSFWEGHEKDTVVYMTYAEHNWNHPHNTAVIINRKDGMIEFSRLG